MTVIAYTKNPQELLSKFVEASNMGPQENGSIHTWSVDADGDLTHTEKTRTKKMWFRPKIEADGLRFGVMSPEGQTIAPEVRAFYHGHLSQTLVYHFSNIMTKVEIVKALG